MQCKFFERQRYFFLDGKAYALCIIEGKIVIFFLSEDKRVIVILKP